jgi:Dyp-type peroxidase family
MLASLQSNIVHPHVRSHLRLLALRVERPGEARTALARIARGMKSARQQLDELHAFRELGRPGTAYVGVAIAASGYARLEIERSRWPDDPAFRAGLRTRSLHDPDPQTWEPAYRDGIDLLLSVGSHDDELTDEKVREVMQQLGDSVRLQTEERGYNLTNAEGVGIEHFGYVDGRSQPLFVDEDLEVERETTDGVDQWNPLVPLSHVLVADPGVDDGDHSYGSYLVYRKLEQNVRAFTQQEERIARELGLTGDDAERVGALLVGRFEDGTPVTLSESDGMRPVPNDFTYDHDRAGARCPYGAHIRLVNPRDADPGERTVIARRGQSYGAPTEDSPAAGVGLLFLAVVAGLERQFEALQHAANGAGGGPFDAIMGQSPGSQDPPRALLSPTWDDQKATPDTCALEPVVRLRGGEYLYLPSIDFLTGLARG